MIYKRLVLRKIVDKRPSYRGGVLTVNGRGELGSRILPIRFPDNCLLISDNCPLRGGEDGSRTGLGSGVGFAHFRDGEPVEQGGAEG